MEGLKPPFFVLATHASEMDFPVMYRTILPYKRANNVVALDAIRDHGEGLMRSVGCIGKRKFVKDYNLIKNLRYCATEYRDILCMYAEARYSLDGCESYLPDSIGKLCKLISIPVVVLRMSGNYIIGPQWNKTRQNLPLLSEIEQIVTADEIKTISVAEINERIRAGFKRDDFRYQYENGIENNYEKRAEGLHHLLYRCPKCKAEFKMYSEKTTLWCSACGKSWQMTTLGQLEAENGEETEFSHIPDWFNWERECVREEVRSGQYHFEDEVTVHTLPNAQRFYDQGKGKLVQTTEGTFLTCTAYGEPVSLSWSGAELEGLHIEYDYPFDKKKFKKNIFGDCVDLSTPDESYFLHPINKRTQLTKLSLATEEIHFLALERLKEE